MREPRELIKFTYPEGSMFEGPGRLIVRAAAHGSPEPEIVLQREGYEPGTWKDHPAENASEAAALVYAATVVACADLVREVDCPCYEAQTSGAILGQQYSPVDGRLLKHAPCCPLALVAAIEALRG